MPDYGKYRVHPVAALFPLMEGDEQAELVKDIEANGLHHPIVLAPDGETIVDGRNRYLACEEARIDPTFTQLGSDYDEQRIIAYILSQNLRRRHMDVGQRALLAVDLIPFLAEAAKDRQGARSDITPKSGGSSEPRAGEVNRQVASLAGVAHSSVAQAKRVKEVSPTLVAQVQARAISLNDAFKQVRHAPKPEPVGKIGAPTIMLPTHDGGEVPYRLPAGKATFNRTNDQVSWASWTWNPVTGCLHGCRYCYARELATRSSYKDAYPIGFAPLFHHERLAAPANTPVPKETETDPRLGRVFVCSMADLYGRWVPDEWIEQVHDSCIANPQFEYLFLTKFPRRYLGIALPRTAWIGTSVDTQSRVKHVEDVFRQIKNVRVRWLSLEPLLEPLKFTDLTMFDWIVIGSQSATDQPDGHVPEFAPPIEWVANIIAQAREAGCRVYCKPNLLGHVDPQSPGMLLPMEEPEFADEMVQQAAE